MSHLRSLTNLDIAVNPKFLGIWPEKVGRYMLNFATIELISYQYLDKLEVTREDFNRNLDKFLSQRIERIQHLVKVSSAIPQALKDEIESLWSAVSDLSEWRNRIAHNALVAAWKQSNPATDPPDLIGIPDVKQLKKGNLTDSISMDRLNKLMDDTAAVAHSLNSAAKKI